MRSARFTFAMICALLLTSVPAGAKENPKDAAVLREKREKEAAALLDGTLWSVEMMSLSGEKGKKSLQDTLRFEDEKIASTALSKEGYPSSNYTLTVGEDGLIVWETMQTKEGAGVVFWRGERQGDTMRGILSKQPLEGNNVDYSFSGKMTGAAAPAAAPAATPAAMTDATSQPPMTAAPPEPEHLITTPAAPQPAAQELASQVSAPASAPQPAAPPRPVTAQKKKKGWW